ncbi:hypothetical protein Agabi119p4_10368 [Agaricus bisporus var. burnettii]|uniref:Uncharacterized protein n=1 Tax=Agaricus bisporus var. burnettii TaxID=192524 RepID=A0A8H7EWC3_AGABI|nr:hypothetical protein Agabi119p4_10368 [Agaricus bisporus var. burnettii]
MLPFQHRYVNIFISPMFKKQNIWKNKALKSTITRGVREVWKKIAAKAQRGGIKGPIRAALVAGRHRSKSDKSAHVTLRFFSGENVEFSTLHARENAKKSHRLFSGLSKKLDGMEIKKFKFGMKVRFNDVVEMSGKDGPS